MDRRKAGLAAGMVAVLVLGGSGALADSPQRGPADDPCGGTATCSPADLAKLKEAEAAKAGGPRKDGPGCAADVDKPGSPDAGDLARALADVLGIGLDRATATMDELKRLSPNGGISPDSPEFAAVAARLGVSAERLHEALKAVKQATAPKDEPKDALKDVPKDGLKDVPKDVPKDGPEDGLKDGPKDVTPSPGTTPGS
ncbi:hypothetical protein [Nonomuraea zeae]|uniref:Uncharacterized protein n=1 Tax=Nonomuraea zeae TaxID=1642303 RepID=A0A5S4FSE3_9ACTN|nr:hypothetical protein [Nonomuraea zeae]TMR23051.1 hypothetical protein ETD85_48575 [Nonomuraea zeae]